MVQVPQWLNTFFGSYTIMAPIGNLTVLLDYIKSCMARCNGFKVYVLLESIDLMLLKFTTGDYSGYRKLKSGT